MKRRSLDAPAHWTRTRLRHVVRLNPSKTEIEDLEPDQDVSFLPMEAIGEDGSTRLDVTRPLSEVQTGYSYFRDEDVVVAKITPCFENGKGALMRGLHGGVGFGTTELIVARPLRGRLSSEYLQWIFQSSEFRKVGEGFMYGAGGQKRVPDDFVRNYRIALPPLTEQTSITAFLDRETDKIDTLVEEQRRLIELLKEKRQAVISHAVTKGLNPNARMKASGVEWLGDVPEHWDIVPCGYRYEVQLGRMLNEERAQGDDLRPYLRVLDVQWHRINVDDLPVMNFPAEVRERYRLEPGDLLVNEGGSYVGRSAIWRGELGECYYQKALHRLRPRDSSRDTADFLLYVMETATKVGVFVAGGNQTTIDHLTAEQLRGQRLPFPPANEQSQIAAFLAQATGRLDLLEHEALSATDLLKEHRAALISAAVTGKIDVRETLSAPTVEAINVKRIRLLVAAEIVGLLSHKKSFGRVKLQKLLYLAEADAGIQELQGQYQREAAGPLDRTLIAEVDAGLQQDQHVSVIQSDGPGSQVVYRLRGEKGAYHPELVASIGDRVTVLRALVEKLGDLDTKSVEAITTLYAVWNDALLDHREPTDAMVVSGVLEDWHPEKARKFKSEELLTWLGWMRRNKLIPRGNGPRTTTGRLFA